MDFELMSSICRFLGAGYFIIVGLMKLQDVELFWTQVMNYGLTTTQQARWLAAALPTSEVALGYLFANRVFPFASGFGLIILLIGFSGAIAHSLSKGSVHDCGCGGRGKVHPILLVRNLGLIALVSIGAFSAPKPLLEEVILTSLAVTAALATIINRYKFLGR